MMKFSILAAIVFCSFLFICLGNKCSGKLHFVVLSMAAASILFILSEPLHVTKCFV